MPVRLSILDLAHVPLGSNVSEALRNVLEFARRADALGYERIWYAEHHAMPSVASSKNVVFCDKNDA